MKQLLSVMALAGIFAFSATMFSTTMISAADKKDEGHEAIEKAMKVGMKGGLLKKVATGKGTADDAEKLHALLVAMAKAAPPKGEQASWDEKTTALVTAAQAAVDGKENAGKLLMKASNCKACHSLHKPS